MKRLSFSRTGLLAVFFLLFAVGQSQAALPPEAQVAFDKGVLAAKEQEWDIAIQSFQEARKTAPNAPEVFYNLGLAESKIPGRELRAIAWFGAYLAAAPHASNVATVKTFIAGLQVKNEGNLDRLIQSIQDQIDKAPVKPSYEYTRLLDLIALSKMWADAGEMTKAWKIVDPLPGSVDKVTALADIAGGQVTAGDLAGARQTLATARQLADQMHPIDWDRRKTLEHQASTYAHIANVQLKMRDVPSACATLLAAQRAVGSIQDDPAQKNIELVAIARDLVNAGCIADAKAMIPDIQKTEGLIQNPTRLDIQDIAYLQLDTGDPSGAEKTLESGGIAKYSNSDLQKIVEEQARAGDIVDAQRNSTLIREDSFIEDQALRAVAYAKIVANDYAGAAQSNDSIKTPFLKLDRNDLDPNHADVVRRKLKIIYDQMQFGYSEGPRPGLDPSVEISDWLERLNESNTSADCYANASNTLGPTFLDLTCLKNVKTPANDPEQLFKIYGAIVQDFLNAKNIIDQMLRQQAKQQETS